MNNKNETYASYSAYLCISLITVYYMLSISKITEEFNLNINVLVYCAIPIFVLNIILQNPSIKQLGMYILCIILGIFSLVITSQATILLTLMQIICCFSCNIKHTMRIMLKIEIAILLINIFLALVGVVSNETVQYQRSSTFLGGLIYRNSLGFSHYNGLGMIGFEITSLCILGFNEIRKNSIVAKFTLVLFNIVIYLISGDRTAFLSCILFVILLLLKKGVRLKQHLYMLAVACLVAFSIVCTWGIFILNEKLPNLFNVINNLFQTRPFYILGYISNYGINLWGNNIRGPLFGLWGDSTQGFNATLDSGFANLVITYGIVVTIIFVLVMINLVNNLNKAQKYSWIIYIIVICVYGLSENLLPFFTYNLSFMMFPYLLRKKVK